MQFVILVNENYIIGPFESREDAEKYLLERTSVAPAYQKAIVLVLVTPARKASPQ